jgi:hypothetical protein
MGSKPLGQIGQFHILVRRKHQDSMSWIRYLLKAGSGDLESYTRQRLPLLRREEHEDGGIVDRSFHCSEQKLAVFEAFLVKIGQASGQPGTYLSHKMSIDV